jgi:biotin transport system substrate-specific component
MTQAGVIKSTRALSIMQCVAGVIAMGVAAQISIPMQPVPITFHTVIVMIIGLTYTPALARNTMAAYIATGALGAPVFTNFSSGIPYMMGPTFGYLVGFLAAASIMPYFQKRYGAGTLSTLCNCLLGHTAIYLLGVAWLGQIIGYEKAIYSGFIVFIPGGIAKIFVLVGMMKYIRRGPQ